jgi:hypothetical protein
LIHPWSQDFIVSLSPQDSELLIIDSAANKVVFKESFVGSRLALRQGKIYKIDFGRAIQLAKVLSIHDYFEQLILDDEVETAVRLVREYASLHDLEVLSPLCELLFIRKRPIPPEDFGFFADLVGKLEETLQPKLLLLQKHDQPSKEEFWEIAAKHQSPKPALKECSEAKEFSRWVKKLIKPKVSVRRACQLVISTLATEELVARLPRVLDKFALKLVRIHYNIHWNAEALVVKNRQLEVISAVHDEAAKYLRYLSIAARSNDLPVYMSALSQYQKLEDFAASLL